MTLNALTGACNRKRCLLDFQEDHAAVLGKEARSHFLVPGEKVAEGVRQYNEP